MIYYYGTTAKLGITFRVLDTIEVVEASNTSMPLALNAVGVPSDLSFCGYSDSDYAGNIKTCHSMTGYVFFMGNGPISWKTYRQNTIMLFSTEAEYYTLIEASKEVIWLQSFFNKLGYTGLDLYPILLYGDNIRALDLVENPTHHAHTKHI